MVHGVRQTQRRGQTKALLWPWSRMTAYRRVQEMVARRPASSTARTPAPRACGAASACGPCPGGIALNMVQRCLGHAQLTTTAIYANAIGEEEQGIAARMWWPSVWIGGSGE